MAWNPRNDGRDEALRRAEAYAKAGADILFVESPESEDEMRRIAGAFDIPVLINNVEGGRTPILPKDELRNMGFKLAICPGTGFLAMGQALEQAYSALQQNDSSSQLQGRLYQFDAFSRLMGFQAVWDFDKAHAED